MVLSKNKGDNLYLYKYIITCYYYNKPNYMCIYYIINKLDKDNTKIIQKNHGYAFFIQHGTHLYKLIMNPRALKYMIFHRMAFDTCKAIVPFDVKFGETKMVHIKNTLHVSKLHLRLFR
jgi:hypothetical protein